MLALHGRSRTALRAGEPSVNAVVAFARRNAGTIAGFLLGAITALCVFGPGFVVGTSSFWDYPPTDFNSHVVGYRMYLLDDWRFPLFHTQTLEEPRGLNLLYMDALPLVALFAKLLKPIVPSFLETMWFNAFGWWPVVAYGLQGAFGARLMRELVGPARVAELCGAAFAVATPVFVLRFLHIALASHFFILAALLLYLQSARGLGTRQAAQRWALLFATLTLVHPYLFAMCAGVFAASVANSALRGRWKDALVVFGSTAAVVLVVVFVSGFHGQEVAKGGMWGYGHKTTDLISFFTPQWATFFPLSHRYQIDMTRNEAAEGWAYLGAGVLIAIVIAAVRAPRAFVQAARTHWPLATALGLMAAFAISNRVTVASKVLFELPLPEALEWPTRQFRSCGRFIWPAVYAVSFYVLALLYRTTRGTRFALVAPFVAGIQLVDAFAAFLYVNAYTSRGEAKFLDWETLRPVIAEHRAITFVPSFECIFWERPVVAFAQMEIEYMAAEHGVGLSSVRSSRPLRDCRHDAAELARTAIVPDRLYLLFPPEVPRATVVHYENAGAPCAVFPRGIACSTRFASGLPRGFSAFSPAVDYELGQKILVGTRDDERYLGIGWSWPEESHRWTDGEAAFLYVRTAEPLRRSARLHLLTAGAVADGDPRPSARVLVNGALAGRIELSAEARPFELPLPDSVEGARLLEIELRSSSYPPPGGVPPGERALGLSVTELRIAP